MTELSKQEKLVLIDEHIKNVETNIFNLNLLVIQESALDPINQEQISALEARLQNAFLKKDALIAEKEKVNSESAE